MNILTQFDNTIVAEGIDKLLLGIDSNDTINSLRHLRSSLTILITHTVVIVLSFLTLDELHIGHFDDVELDVGKLRIRPKGSAGGHNGMKNIIAQIGTSDFARLRIGVGEKPEGWDLADHVLAHFPKEEEEAVRESLKKTVEAVRCFLSDGIAETMNRFNG